MTEENSQAGIEKAKKRNVSTDFEGMYLRYNMVKKYISSADPELLNNKYVKKAVNAITDRYFYRCHDILVHNGFAKDDVHSIVRLFALTFFGHSNVQIVDDKAVRFMSRYINQRLQTLTRWIAKKFGVSDSMRIQSTMTNEDGSDWFQYVMDRKSLESYGLEPEVIPENDPIEIVTKGQKAEVQALKRKLSANIDKYANTLCYYATVKHVAFNVRRVARTVCRKHGIDYVEWLKRKASETDLDLSQFTF